VEQPGFDLSRLEQKTADLQSWSAVAERSGDTALHTHSSPS
jgi:hypothetical protein